jgi:predicted DNA-binding transcriptional regulator AlpA
VSNEVPVRLIPAHEVAKRLGIKTKTLGAWRSQGKGPQPWRRMGRTLVVYPESAVDHFIKELFS